MLVLQWKHFHLIKHLRKYASRFEVESERMGCKPSKKSETDTEEEKEQDVKQNAKKGSGNKRSSRKSSAKKQKSKQVWFVVLSTVLLSFRNFTFYFSRAI